MKEQSNKATAEIGSKRPADAEFQTGRTITIAGNSFDTREIFVGTREVIITHGGERYRLRLTAQNKLILTK